MLKNKQQNEIAMLLGRKKGWSLQESFAWISEFEDIVEAIYDMGFDDGHVKGYEEADTNNGDNW